MDPRLDYFIVRPDTEDGMPGPIVPLIAVDQLPDWIQLAGVPRELDAEQTIGLNNLGIVEMEDDSIFEVRLHHDKIRAILNCADEGMGSHSSGNGEAKAKATKNKRTTSLCETKSKTNEKTASKESPHASAGDSTFTGPHQVEEPLPHSHLTRRMLSASRHNIANTEVDIQARRSSRSSSNEKHLRPHMTEAIRDESRPAGLQRTTARQDKQPATAFCRHWCYHGTCKWGLECRYKHRMPTTVEGLREVGLKDFPMWYLLMTSGAGSGLPGLSSMDTMLSGLEDVQPPAQQQQQPPPFIQHHVPKPPSLDPRPVQGRKSESLAPDGPASNRQKLKQIREARHLLLRGGHATQGQQHPRPHNSSNYANLYANASVAANAASIRRRQQQIRDNIPVVTRVRARVQANIEDGYDSGGVGGRALLPARQGGQASNDYAGERNVRSPGFVTGRPGFGEEKLVDID